MTMLQIHMDALNSVPVAYHEFLIRYKANANIVYGIVEGKEDPMFYRGLIERHLPEGWEVELIPAGCKDKVISAKNAFDWSRFSPNRICFFIDRDLSELIEDGTISGDNVYITDNYSIENDAVNIGVLKRLLVEIFNIHDLEPTEWEVIYQRFSSALSDFQDFMVPIMAQIILWRRSGKRPCLNDIQPKDFFFFKHGEIKFRTNFESSLSRLEHAGKCVKLQPSHNTEVSYAENEFRQRNGPERLIRGKYLLWFLVAFALEVHSSISVLIDRLDESPKVRISIGLANAMVVLAPRVRCPQSLKKFLDRTYEQYIRDRNHPLIPEG
ncbi:DUF4435 domain-containing protein [Acidithiobacillus albertensis]|uniref:DUF4435 domain-containing protein n=1 Tax=Acidithiobacillus albertensis TaxID=119978 RepID=UPI00094AC4CC|nr:DUF4435 domain-containing protein [Acidithiobacillus albertensis]